MFRHVRYVVGLSQWLPALLVMVGLHGYVREVPANETQAMKYYGKGVHDFYDGRYLDALQNLDRATSYEPRDARIYYFRGLAKRRLGYDATADFQMAAQIETALRQRDVGRALIRVQGADRLAIEEYREQARKLPAETVQQLVPPPAAPPVVARQSERTRLANPDRPRNPVRRVVRLETLPTDDTDPFRQGVVEVLGQGAPQPSQAAAGDALTGTSELAESDPSDAEPDAFAEDQFGGEAPFGSGVDRQTGTASEDAVPDPFDDGFAAGAAGVDQGAAPTTGSKKPGALGAAFRAFTRGLTPSVPAGGQELLDRVRPGGAGPAGADDAESDFDDPGFDEPDFSDAETEDPDAADADPSDPFADDPAMSEDEAGAEEEPLDDPFADDPFGSK
jgi:hypothetical protein